MMKYRTEYAQISGIRCYISKIKVIPIGDFDMEHMPCPDIDLVWEDYFTLIGFYINNRLEKLNKNLEKID